MAGEGTFKALAAAYVKNPKDIVTVFGLARKYGDRYDTAKAAEKAVELAPESAKAIFKKTADRRADRPGDPGIGGNNEPLAELPAEGGNHRLVHGHATREGDGRPDA